MYLIDIYFFNFGFGFFFSFFLCRGLLRSFGGDFRFRFGFVEDSIVVVDNVFLLFVDFGRSDDRVNVFGFF